MREHSNKLSRRAFLGGAATFGAVSLISPSLAFAKPTAAEKQAEADSVRIQVDEMRISLSEASDNYYLALQAHDDANEAIVDAEARIEAISSEIEEVQDKLGTRVNSMYKSGNTSFLDLLLGSASFEEFVNNWDILTKMNQNDAEMVQTSKDLREEEEELKVELENQKQIAADKLAEAEQIKEDAEATVVEMETLLNSLDAEARQLLEEEQAAAEAARVAEEARRLEAERAAAAANEQNNSSNDSGSSPSSEGGGGGGGGGGGSTGGDGNGSTAPAPGSLSSAADYAESRIGCPYVWAATGPNSFDCSGLTMWSYAQAGKSIPRDSESQYAGASWRGSVSQAKRGDVLYTYGHVGIACAAGGDPYVHAPQPGQNVCKVYGASGSFSSALRF